MKLFFVSCAAFLAFTATALPAQGTAFTDPANLRGERVKPLDGRELPIDQGASGLQQMLRKLNTRASLMLIVAHPDDEDGGMLTYYSRGFGARVATLTLTRGEGGQNAMTGDFEDALGLLRTQELLAADRYMGVDQMFGTEVDFGFSKTKEEAFAKWTHERVLYDAVRAVRLYRPLVIAAVFIGGVTDGHGQHQVSGEIAQEVFKAAGDPKVFPELTAQGILPWQPLKVYARVPMGAIRPEGLYDYATGQYAPAQFTNYVTGEVTKTTPSADVVVHEGATDPVLTYAGANPRDIPVKGDPARTLSYVQFGRIGLGLQKSQIGPGVRNAPSGVFDVSYHRYGSRLPNQPGHESTFFDGIDLSLKSLLDPRAPKNLQQRLDVLTAQIQEIVASFSPEEPKKIAPLLATAAAETNSLVSMVEISDKEGGSKADLLHELRIKQAQLNTALSLALGLSLDATVRGPEQTAGSRPVVTAQLRSNLPEELSVERQWLENAQGTELSSGEEHARTALVSKDRAYTRTFSTTADFTATVTRPYFERSDIEVPVYRMRIADLRNAPASPNALVAWETVAYRGATVQIGRVVHDGTQPLAFLPEVSVTLDRSHQALPAGSTTLSVPVHVAAGGGTDGSLRMTAPNGWAVRPQVETLTTTPPPFAVHVPAAPTAAATTLTATATSRLGGVYSEGFRPVGYGDLPRTNYFTPATLRVVPVDLKLPVKRRIGYLPGTGDAVPEGLASVGLPVTMLTVADMAPQKLAQFDTVVLGVRTYNAHPDLHGAPTQALLDFAHNGGNVVVQYQTGEFTGEDAPYPLTLGNAEKVVDETDPVKLLDASAPLLASPNRLTRADFNGWVEERGHGFLGTWDPHYTALTETADPGQSPQRGGLITTALGHGHWTYCAFALYRQLPEAVPGAYRMFANMLGLANAR